MVLITKLSGSIDINKLFPLLPITRINCTQNKSRFRFPNCGIRGAIISARYRGVCRGIEKNAFFMNNIIIDICNGNKNINIKLSSNTMHICGCKSMDVAKDAVELLLQIIYSVNDIIKAYKDNNYINVIKELTKGKLTENGHLIKYEQSDDAIINYFMELAKDFVYYEDFVKQLEWISELDEIIDKPALSSIDYVVVNYGYNLGFEVDRRKLCDCINNYNGFIASYENELEHKVNILLPYASSAKNKKTSHKFIVHKSGYVKQSSPNIVMAQEAYHKFQETIKELRAKIEKSQ